MTTNFPDYLDPQMSYTAEGWRSMWNSYLPLLTFRHQPGQAGTEVVPGLTESMPEVSADLRTYRLQLRPDLFYSDGSEVRASDFQATIQRLFDLNSPGAPLYSDIVGAATYQAGGADRITGIRTNNRTGAIQIRLATPDGTFADKLALMFSAPVPANTPAKPQTKTPIPATGPFTVGDVDPGQEFTLRRNPEWAAANSKQMPDLPSAQLDEIQVRVQKNPSSQVTLVERNQADFMFDPPPTDRLSEVESDYGQRFQLETSASTYYFWINTNEPPFDDVRVRRAVNYAIDPKAISRIYTGLISTTQQILPPSVPGYEKFELYPHDMAKARELIAKANPSDREITVWGDNEGPSDRAVAYYQDLLRRLGFDAKLKLLSPSVYFETIGNAETPDLDTGWSNWYQSYPHPNDFFQLPLGNDGITPVYASNYGSFENAAINHEISVLAGRAFTPATERRYSGLDRRVMRLAPWAPYGNYRLATFVSDRIDFEGVYFHPVFTQDFTSFAPAD